MPLLFPNGPGVRPIVRLNLERQITVQGEVEIGVARAETAIDVETPETEMAIAQAGEVEVEVETPETEIAVSAGEVEITIVQPEIEVDG